MIEKIKLLSLGNGCLGNNNFVDFGMRLVYTISLEGQCGLGMGN